MITFPLAILNPPIIAADTDFVFTINTALGTGNTFQLPLPSGQTYNFVVDWGDSSQDTITVYNQAETLHTYSSGGIYQIRISGKCGGWSFNNGGDKLKVTSVDQWGDVGFDYLQGGFYGCTNLTSLATDGIKSTASLNLINLFHFCNFPTVPNNLLHSCPNVVGVAALFRNNTSLTSVPADLLQFCTLITGADAILRGCTGISEIPVDFLRYCTLLESLLNAFGNMGNLTIHQDIFRYNINMLNFGSVFAGSTLTSIVEDLFYHNPLVTNYSYALYRQPGKALPTRLFNLSNLGIVTNFDYFLESSTTANSNTGTIQDVWNYAISATSVNTFLNQTALTNYASIPNSWKGL